MRALVFVALVSIACGGGRDSADGEAVGQPVRRTVDAGTSVRGAIGDDGVNAVLDELVHAIARDDDADAVAGMLGAVEVRSGDRIVIRPRRSWMSGAKVALRIGGGVARVELELATPVAAQELVDALVLAPAAVPSAPPLPTFVAVFSRGAVEVRMDDATSSDAISRLSLRWVDAPHGSGRQRPSSWRITIAALAEQLRRQGPEVIAASLGIRQRSTTVSPSASPRPPWLAGAKLWQEGAAKRTRTIVELTLVEAIAPAQLAEELELEPAAGDPSVLVPRPRSLAAFEGELRVSLEPAVVRDGAMQRLRLAWLPFERPRVPPPPPAIVATPWYALIRELERRIVRGDDADTVDAWLREQPRPWLARASVARADGAPRIVGKVMLELSPAIPVDDIVAAFGHHEEWIPIHFRDEPEELAFDPTVSREGQLRLVAMLEEPGTRPPHGTVRRLELTWTPAPPRRPRGVPVSGGRGRW